MDANSLKRLVVTALSGLAIVLNKKLGLELGEFEIGALASVIVTFLVGSNVKAIADKKAAAAAAAVDSPEKAAEVLGGKVAP